MKQHNKQATNAEVSKILSNMWKEAPAELKKEYSDQEAIAREEYKKKMTEWRIEKEKQKKDPSGLCQENEKRNRQGLAREEKEKYGYCSDVGHHVEKSRRSSKEASRHREGKVARVDVSRVPCGTSRLDNLFHTLGGHPAQAQLVAPHLLGQSPSSLSYPSGNPVVLVPSTLSLQRLRKLSHCRNGVPRVRYH